MSGIQLNNSQPLFTVITITYNQEAWVEQAIKSVLSSSFTDFEYIIADDNSSDGTWEVINRFNDNRIKKFRNETNIREYPNRNKALGYATGKFVMYLDGDDIMYKHTLRNLAEILSHFPDTGMVWGVPETYFHFCVFPFQFSSEQLVNLLYRTLIPIGITGLSETVFNTECLKKLGGFSTKFGIGDYYVKIKMATETNAVFIPKGMAFWRQNDNQATVQVSKKYRSFIERVIIDKELMKAVQKRVDNKSFSIIHKNIRIKNVKLLVSNTLIKGRLIDFIRLCRKIRPNPIDFLLLFTKGDYSYKPTPKKDKPLYNNFNFQ